MATGERKPVDREAARFFYVFLEVLILKALVVLVAVFFKGAPMP